MKKPSHTHRAQGGRFALVAEHAGTGPLEGLQAAKDRAMTESIGRQEQEWRDGRGFGPGGRRHTGD